MKFKIILLALIASLNLSAFEPLSPENSCELWLYEERDGSVDVYKFTSRYLPD